MSIVSEKLYTIQCDRCKEFYIDENTGFGFWIDQESAEQNAIDDNWAVDDDEHHYCPKCYFYDEENDLIIIKK